MTFTPPPIKNGHPISFALASIGPASTGAIAAPNVRATPVTPAAADLSSGRTTAIVYDCRVGTSICEIANRASSTAIADHELGISGTSISRIFDGKCVNTIVLISPNQFDSRAATSPENPAKKFVKKKIDPSCDSDNPNFKWNHSATILSITNPPPNASTNPPPPTAPIAAAIDPTRTYHANNVVLFSPEAMCDSAACSMDKKGPTSFPLGLITPIVAATSSTTQFLDNTKTTPANTIN